MSLAIPQTTRPGLRAVSDTATMPTRPTGLRWVMAAELFASAVGFGVMVHLARCLGPESFARIEYASAVAAWLLVIVRGGIDVIVAREAARRPRLIAPLTDVLIGLRFAAAFFGYGIVLVLAVFVGQGRGAVLAVAGLMLFPSAFVADVGPRALGCLRVVAGAQVVRVLGYAIAVLSLVRGSGDALFAACCLVTAEFCGALVPFGWHMRRYGTPRPRYRRRAWMVLAHRGAIAGLIRFGRVSLYGADLLVLGWWAGAELGPYAAGRRVVFGLVGLGLVIPASLAPAIARRWACGAALARALIEDSLAKLWAFSIPASLVLMLTSSHWMPLLFGESYREGGPWLALIAARLPWLLTASFIQTSLVSCRRETWVLDQMIGLLILAVVLVPLAVVWGGPWGVGWVSLILEVIAALGSWRMLGCLGLSPRWREWRQRRELTS